MAFEILDQDGYGIKYKKGMPLIAHSLLASGIDSCPPLMQMTVICESAS